MEAKWSSKRKLDILVTSKHLENWRLDIILTTTAGRRVRTEVPVWCFPQQTERQHLISWASSIEQSGTSYVSINIANPEAEFMHVRTISLRFLGIVLTVLRLQVSVYNVYITNQFPTTFAGGGWARRKTLKTWSQLRPRIRPQIRL